MWKVSMRIGLFHGSICYAIVSCSVISASQQVGMHKPYPSLIKMSAAVRNEEIDVVGSLLRARISPNFVTQGTTPLIDAVRTGNQVLVQLLLEGKASVNGAGEQGVTPLHAAAITGSGSIVALLLDNRASVNQTSHSGITPLAWAVSSRRVSVAGMLLSHHDVSVPATLLWLKKANKSRAVSFLNTIMGMRGVRQKQVVELLGSRAWFSQDTLPIICSYLFKHELLSTISLEPLKLPLSFGRIELPLCDDVIMQEKGQRTGKNVWSSRVYSGAGQYFKV